MGKFTEVEDSIFAIFAGEEWDAEGIPTFPNNYNPTSNLEEFIRVDVIPSGMGININSLSGLIIIEIFTPAGKGPRRATEIADILDKYFAGKSSASTQFMQSNFRSVGNETAYYHCSYSIQFNFYKSFN
jgi:hypothetical protein